MVVQRSVIESRWLAKKENAAWWRRGGGGAATLLRVSIRDEVVELEGGGRICGRGWGEW